MYQMGKYLQIIDEVIEQGPYSDNWASLSKYRPPQWYTDAKFGIFIHWGVYSVPAFGSEWYSRNMYIQGDSHYEHHIKTYGPQKKFGYKDFIPLFKAEKFNADEWAELFVQAGAGYVVPVAEHHDGFQMYRSEISHWNAWEMGPKRDVLGELEKAFDSKGLITGASSHRAEHWFFMGHGKEFESDIKEPLYRGDLYWPSMPEPPLRDLYGQPCPTQEYLEDWLVRTCEIIDRYRPKLLYFDWWIQHSSMKPYLKKLMAYYYNRAAQWGEEVVLNYKHDAVMLGCAVLDIERGQFAAMKPYPWQTDTSVALNSWCYTENNKYRTSRELICDLVDIVSKNGNLLLNIGPKADGTIPEEDRSILLEIGKWLAVNGEAIYGTHVWKRYGEGPAKIVDGQFSDSVKKEFTSKDIRYTAKENYLYATVMKCNQEGIYEFPSLGEQDAGGRKDFHGIIRGIRLLGTDEKVEWSREEEALKVCIPNFYSENPIVFRIEID